MRSSWLTSCNSLVTNPNLRWPILCFYICFNLFLQFFHPHLLHFKHIFINDFTLSSFIILKGLLISLNLCIFEHLFIKMLQIRLLSLLFYHLSIYLKPLSHQTLIPPWLKAQPMLTNIFPKYLYSSVLFHCLCFLITRCSCLEWLIFSL